MSTGQYKNHAKCFKQLKYYVKYDKIRFKVYLLIERMTKMATLGTVLRLFRMTKNNTIKELSQKMVIPMTYICDIEHDRKRPSFNSLKKFSEYYNVPRSEFLRIQEISDKENFSFEKTFLEVVQTYLKYNP